MRLFLDAFSCAAIGADGYRRALGPGWQIVCLDSDARALEYARAAGYETVHGDAISLLGDAGFMGQFDAIHASPPCQLFSATRQLAKAQGKGRGRAVDLLHPVIDLFRVLDTPYIVENVERSPLKKMAGVVRLCGSSFGLPIQRHRLFLSNVPLEGTTCDHTSWPADPITDKPRPWGVYYALGDRIPAGGRTFDTYEDACAGMGVDPGRLPYYEKDHKTSSWKYLCEALPPAYTEHLGRQLIAHL